MRSLWRIAIALPLVFAGCGKSSSHGPDAGTSAQCQIKSTNEKIPGYPYDLNAFSSQILPFLSSTCMNSGCHDSKSHQGNFIVYGGTKGSSDAKQACAFAMSFNAFNDQTDLNNPINSKVYVALSGGDPIHPIKLDPTMNMNLMQILSYIQAAAKNNGGTQGSGNNCYDKTTFAQVQTAFDSTGCSAAACHGDKTTAGGKLFFMNANAMSGTSQFDDNYNAVQNLTDLTNPKGSVIYTYATNSHMGPALSATDAQTLLSWIQAAAKACPPGSGGGGGTVNSCVNTDKFNLGVFRDEIMPILDGTVNLNDQGGGNGTGEVTGCTRSACHGTQRGQGTLYLSDSQSAAQNLADFSCFVDLTNPSQSEALLCPLNAPGCRTSAGGTSHPGGSVFVDGTDLNYQRILSFIYGASNASPFDFAFFARKINPIFSDPNAVQGGAQAGLTCSDATECHGVQVAGQPPPNGSNFPILVNANALGGLSTNFVSASAFASFLTPDQSSLFLYPTDQIFNLIGIHHPGGLDFAPDSQFAKDILQWAGGLRPDGNGANKNWLVAGDYTGTQITDTTPIDESAMNTPKIFDSDGQQQFNAGEWDGLFSANDTVDLNDAFPRDQQNGRIGYALAYIINTTPTDIQANIQVSSKNDIEVFAGSASAEGLNGAGANITVDLPAFDTAKTTTKLLIKVFQPAGAGAGFSFSTIFRDNQGQLLTDQTGELVFKLDPQGGI